MAYVTRVGVGCCTGGNLRLVAALTEGLPIMYNSVVKEIRYSKNRVAVRTATHEFQGKPLVQQKAPLHYNSPRSLFK